MPQTHLCNESMEGIIFIDTVIILFPQEKDSKNIHEVCQRQMKPLCECFCFPLHFISHFTHAGRLTYYLVITTEQMHEIVASWLESHVLAQLDKKYHNDSTCFDKLDSLYDYCKLVFHHNRKDSWRPGPLKNLLQDPSIAGAWSSVQTPTCLSHFIPYCSQKTWQFTFANRPRHHDVQLVLKALCLPCTVTE